MLSIAFSRPDNAINQIYLKENIFIKKKLSLMLIVSLVTLVLYQPVTVEASEAISISKGDFEIISQTKEKGSDKIIKEVLRSNEVYYFYEETDDQVVSYTQTENEVYFTVNDGKFVYSGSFDLISSGKMSFEEIKESVVESYLKYDKIEVESLLSNKVDNSNIKGSSGKSMADKKADIIENIQNVYNYPAPYNRYLASRTLSGNQGKLDLYETFGFYVEEKGSIFFVAGALVSAVASTLAFSPSSILAIVSFTTSAQGIYTLVADSWIDKFDTHVIYTKVVMYGSQLKHQSVKKKIHATVAGDRSSTFKNDPTWSTDSDFYHYQDLFDAAEQNL